MDAFQPLAQDPAKRNRFADEIMRYLSSLARDRTQNRYSPLLIARVGAAVSRQDSPR
jgi:hypothetical protein